VFDVVIEYVEVRNKINREIIGIIDGAKSVIWHSIYYGVGDFEIYCALSSQNKYLLQIGNYVTRPDDENVGVIEKLQITNSVEDGKMIVASGRFAKSILDRRHIYNLSGTTNSPTILRGNVETAVRNVVNKNIIACPFDNRRNISFFELGALANIPKIIVDDEGNAAQKQVSYDNLLSYTDEVLAEYKIAGKVILDDDTKKLQYCVYTGTDRSATNANDPVIFASEYDNLTGSDFLYDTETTKNAALIGGEGEGYERFYSVIKGTSSGLERRETWVNASSINRTMPATDLQDLFPTGTFSTIYFKVNGTIYATINADTEREVTLNSLQEDFPNGVVSGTKFIVGGVVYANKIYGEEDKYNYTPIGYKATLDVEGKEGDYTLTDAVYKALLDASGKQVLAQLPVVQSFDGTIETNGGVWRLNEDYFLGDVVTIQDNDLNKFDDVRITEITEVQDENGYSVSITYEGE